MVSTIAEQVDASSALVPPASDEGNFVEDLEASSGLVLRPILWFIRKAFGVSPIEELVKPIAGDWNQLSKAKDAWGRTEIACNGVGKNFGALKTSTTEWTGPSSVAFRDRMGKLEENYTKYGTGCDQIGRLVGALIDITKSVASTIATIIGFIADEITFLAACASIPGPGWLVGGAKIATSIRKYWNLIQRGYNAIRRVLMAINSFVKGCYAVVNVLRVLTVLSNTLIALQNYGTGTDIDDAQANNFGVPPGTVPA